MGTTKERLTRIIGDYIDIEEKELDANMNIKCDIGIDSFGLVSLICAIETEFGVCIPDSKMAEFETLGDMVEYIDSFSKEVVAL